MLLPSSGANANDRFYIRPEGIHKNNLPAMQESWIPSLGWEDLLEEGMATHFSILAGESDGQRRLAGCIPQSCKESDTTEVT